MKDFIISLGLIVWFVFLFYGFAALLGSFIGTIIGTARRMSREFCEPLQKKTVYDVIFHDKKEAER